MRVVIEVRRKGGGFYAEIRAVKKNGAGRLVGLCGHESETAHPTPGQANNCGADRAREMGWVVYEL